MLPLQQPSPQPEPRRQRGPQEVYLRRDQLSAAEQALLDLVLNLSRRHGICYAGERFMADQLGCSDRWVRKLLGRLVEKGYVALNHRAGRSTLIKPRKEGPDPAPPTRIGPPRLSRPRNDRSAPPRNDRSTPGRNDRSALTGISTDHLFDDAPLFDRRPKRFNPLQWSRKNDTRRPEQRLCEAVRSGVVLYVQHQRRQRVIQSVRYSGWEVCCYLLPEGGEGQELEKLIIPIRELGGWWFGR